MSETTFRDDVETRLDAAEQRIGQRITELEAEIKRLRGLLDSIYQLANADQNFDHGGDAMPQIEALALDALEPAP